MELLHKLTPKVQDLRGLPGGGPPDLPPEVIAGALAGLPDGPYYLARAAWCDDVAALRPLLRLVVLESSRWVAARDVIYPGVLRDLSAIAIASVVEPRLCVRCEGRGDLHGRRGVVVPCSACGGSGTADRPTDSVRRQLRISTRKWHRLELGYNEIERMIGDWSRVAMSHVYRRIGDEYLT